MANTFITPDVVAREALMILRNNLITYNLFRNPAHQAVFTGTEAVGDTLKVRVPAARTVKEFSGTATSTDLTESYRSLVVEKHFYDQLPMSSKDWTLELQDFSSQVVAPVVTGIAEGVDSYVLGKVAAIPYYVGAANDPPDSLGDILDVVKELDDNKVPTRNRLGILNSQGKRDFLAVSEVHDASKRADGGQALRAAQMGRIAGLDWFMDQNVATHTAGTWSGDSGSLLINGAVAAGETSMDVDTGTGSATFLEGDVFSVAGADGTYVVTADGNLTTGAGTVSFYPAAPTGGFDDNAAVTIIGDHKMNVACHPNAFSVVAFPPEAPRGAPSSVIYDEDTGLGIRVIFDFSSTGLNDTITFDLYCGAEAVHRELAVRILG